MSLFGLDLDADHARAVCGPAGTPRPALLDGDARNLPLAVSLEKRKPQVGRAGLELCRRLPHLACLAYLPHLGSERTWNAGRHRLDAGQLMTLVTTRLQPALAGVRGVVVALPAYLDRQQVGVLAGLFAKARWPLLGTVTVPLAAAWAAHARQPWCGLAGMVEADGHALTWAALAADESSNARQLRVLRIQKQPSLGVRFWKERVLDGIADRCIRQSRRDPRESAVAEQGLYDQFDAVFDACLKGESMELAVQGAHWYQSLTLPAPEVEAFTTSLARSAAKGLQALLTAVEADGPPAVILVGAGAARLPGLLTALENHTSEQTAITLLPADTAARAAHELASRWQSAAQQPGHHDVALPLRASATPPVRKSILPAREHTKIPPRKSKLLPAEDDFSVTIDD